MELTDASQLATSLMSLHGLSEWTFAFDRGRRRAGACHHAKRTITLSAALTRLYDEATVRDVVLHEIAHALVGARHGHDRVWREAACRIGARPQARLSNDLPSVQAPWVGTCPGCGATKELYRSPQRVTSCGKCSPTFCADFILQWTRRGKKHALGRLYQREYVALQRKGLIPRA
ncbi:SprT-like domain-containing protein [Schaalia suimastitidis]|uniref:SprT-like domain-containing protein n=1 Tax=Schaalia suimastitidis TaxID=121163 RepID=UPI0004061A28|nr:SprT-like domain-containing protein [Schaalia suimastitidis]